jgi:hypothetical protein
MSKPVLLTVDDDPEVLNAIERDLRHHFRTDAVTVVDGVSGGGRELPRPPSSSSSGPRAAAARQ